VNPEPVNVQDIFSCKLCGHCCHGESTVSLSQAEQDAIASFLDLDPAGFLRKFCIKKGNRVEMKVVDGPRTGSVKSTRSSPFNAGDGRFTRAYSEIGMHGKP